ncbi:aspartate racemase [Orenia metallireducens]|jgi:aspartate racemase|uniref:Aspartate racemase n=1 Tax=Orenia metallireducens TaxID=1413210 RepID=A0A285HNS6_9FIRM|nr:aspartate/glutamate racemase family protein [Orenia metallireducens]PRX27993.1 aspartate racemase [Orenia metallireducens]SNY37390.1 aspartate racemase [Orenia metallireducens]
MRTIGLIGGMSWESSLEYYRIINKIVKERLGEPHSCKSIMYSVDFAEIDKLQHQGEWEVLTDRMVQIAKRLEKAGAELILICTNTMHKMAEDVQENIKVPLLHIADATAEEIKAKPMEKVGLLGTKFTMEQDFYKKRLKKRHGIDVIIPDEKEREFIHNVIFKELVSGVIKEESRDRFKEIIINLKNNGAEGVVLGCTEIPLLIREKDSSIPIFNTMLLHAKKAVELALKSGC